MASAKNLREQLRLAVIAAALRLITRMRRRSVPAACDAA